MSNIITRSVKQVDTVGSNEAYNRRFRPTIKSALSKNFIRLRLPFFPPDFAWGNPDIRSRTEKYGPVRKIPVKYVLTFAFFLRKLKRLSCAVILYSTT
jgi:hypothetical protein